MARDWEAWIANSTGPASNDEDEKRDRTEERIRDVIHAAPGLGSSVSVRAKGSYANNTNVRRDSDVDVAVEWTNQFKVSRFGAAIDKKASQLGYEPAEKMISAEELRLRVETALINAFGAHAVDTTGASAIRVEASSTTLDADVSPCFALRRYDGPSLYHEGQRLYPKGGSYKDNWPEQCKKNGNKKNVDTGRRYKGMIRALKRLENEMVEAGALGAEVPGYLIECLVWNVPNDGFGHARLLADMRHILAHVFNKTLSDEACKEWGEVNELKYLFRPNQKWTRVEAHDFASRAWDYIGFT